MSPDLPLLRARAADKVFARIRGLREHSSSRIATMLGYIEAHLFDPDLSVSQLKRDCGIRDNSIAILFHSSLGIAPGAFITQCRIEVAEELLRLPDLPIWKISELLGYSSIQVFSRAFFRRTGLRPSAYRKRRALPVATNAGGDHVVLRALRGELDDAEAAALIRHLLELYPPRGGRDSLAAVDPSPEKQTTG